MLSWSAKFFTGKTRTKIAPYLLIQWYTFMVFIARDVRDVRPPRSRRSSSRSTKKFRAPQLPRNPRAQLRLARTHDTNRNRNRFPGWTHPPNLQYIYIYIHICIHIYIYMCKCGAAGPVFLIIQQNPHLITYRRSF